MPQDDVAMVTQVVASVGNATRDEIKAELARRLRQRTGHMPDHPTLNRLVDRALESSRVYADQEGNYRAAD